VSKNALFHKEKESARTMARCQVSLDKSSKNYSRYENEPSQATCIAIPSPTPQSIGGFWWRVFHVVEQNTLRKDAKKTSENHATKIGGLWGEGGVTRGLILLDNG
jgi:hypothetical protein